MRLICLQMHPNRRLKEKEKEESAVRQHESPARDRTEQKIAVTWGLNRARYLGLAKGAGLLFQHVKVHVETLLVVIMSVGRLGHPSLLFRGLSSLME